MAAAIGAPCVLASHAPNRAPPTGVILNRVLRPRFTLWGEVRATGQAVREDNAAAATLPRAGGALRSLCGARAARRRARDPRLRPPRHDAACRAQRRCGDASPRARRGPAGT